METTFQYKMYDKNIVQDSVDHQGTQMSEICTSFLIMQMDCVYKDILVLFFYPTK